MKKVLSLLLALFMFISFSACQNDSPSVLTDGDGKPAAYLATSDNDPESPKEKLDAVLGDDVNNTDPSPEKNDDPVETPSDASDDETDSITVYVTDYGEKYHSDGCQYLRKSKNAIDLEKAKSKGYTPCSKCAPPK